jgi:hypothetical protein
MTGVFYIIERKPIRYQNLRTVCLPSFFDSIILPHILGRFAQIIDSGFGCGIFVSKYSLRINHSIRGSNGVKNAGVQSFKIDRRFFDRARASLLVLIYLQHLSLAFS